MKEYVELSGRVFRISVTPDTPGRCKRRATISLESGPQPTEEEWHAIKASVVAALVVQGDTPEGWCVEDDTPEGG